jgi:hypothetical protein
MAFLPARQRFRMIAGTSLAALSVLFVLDLRSGSSTPTASDTLDSLNALSSFLEVRSETVLFGAGSAGRWLLQDGFYHPDDQGALMSQDFASIRFNTGNSEPVSASLLLSAFPIDGSPSVGVTLSSSIDDLDLEVAGIELLTVALDGSSAQELTLTCRVGESQFDLDLGPDLRPQCLRVLELTVSLEGK